MYTIEWASDFTGFSKNEQMDLHKFVLFYHKYIANKNFIYKTKSPVLPSFVVESRQNQLPHLMGLQYWNNLSVKQPGKQFNLLLNGEWSLSFLQAADEGSYKEFITRIESLANLYNLLYRYDCHIKLIHKTLRSPFRNRKIDMIFQKEGEKLVCVLELREKGANVFVLTSMTIHNKNASALKGKFIKLDITEVTVENDKY